MNRILPAALAALLSLTLPALAHDGVHVNDAYARVNGGVGKTGAVFLVVENHAVADDRLVDAASDVAAKVQLHTHADVDGIMQMRHVPEGFVIPGMGSHALQRGGDHVMLMGLTRALKDGDTFPLTLTFENAGPVTVDVTVDNKRSPEDAAPAADAGHSGHGASN